MVSADKLYKFRSEILKKLYNNMTNAKGDLADSIYEDLKEKVEKIEFDFGSNNSCIKVFLSSESDKTEIINSVDKNIREFISSNRDKLDLNSNEDKSAFEEFINSGSLYEFFIIGNIAQFSL